MPSVLFSPPFSSCDPAQGRTMDSRSGEPIPCYGEEIPCSPREQGIASKTLGLLREMAVRLAKMVKNDRDFANFPVLFPVFRESGPAERQTKPSSAGAPHHEVCVFGRRALCAGEGRASFGIMRGRK